NGPLAGPFFLSVSVPGMMFMASNFLNYVGKDSSKLEPLYTFQSLEGQAFHHHLPCRPDVVIESSLSCHFLIPKFS
ncbi:MAG: hypothetical protein V3R37_09465, partial [Rhodospirillales bacterium]